MTGSVSQQDYQLPVLFAGDGNRHTPVFPSRNHCQSVASAVNQTGGCKYSSFVSNQNFRPAMKPVFHLMDQLITVVAAAACIPRGTPLPAYQKITWRKLHHSGDGSRIPAGAESLSQFLASTWLPNTVFQETLCLTDEALLRTTADEAAKQTKTAGVRRAATHALIPAFLHEGRQGHL